MHINDDSRSKVGLPIIKVIGVAGGGCNILSRFTGFGLPGIECIAINFDWQALECTKAPVKVYLQSTYRGLDDPGKENRQEDVFMQKDKIRQAIGTANAVIVVAGLGGGTGSDVSPMVLSFAKEQGSLTAGVFNTPFYFEGVHRKAAALEAVKEISKYADVLQVISADVIMRNANKTLGVDSAFNLLNETVAQVLRDMCGFISSAGFCGR